VGRDLAHLAEHRYASKGNFLADFLVEKVSLNESSLEKKDTK
jgi:hypothetical protein